MFGKTSSFGRRQFGAAVWSPAEVKWCLSLGREAPHGQDEPHRADATISPCHVTGQLQTSRFLL